jgi:predicted TIM-barrel fold metal-dependent hydrolase
MGVHRTILLPAGRPVDLPSTNNGVSNGLEATCAGNERCFHFAREHGKAYLFGANEVPDIPEAVKEIERYLKRGGVVIGEQKFHLECDSPEMQRIYALAGHYNVPVLMHWQFERFNTGFERFHTMLEKYPRTRFVGHAQTWWANINKDYSNWKDLYPKGNVTRGGITDRYLSDYPNMFGDLSAGSGLNALRRDEGHAHDFLHRHQDKLIYGSDCDDLTGLPDKCQGAQTIAMIRKLVPEPSVRRKLFWENGKRVFRLSA